jgi:hypothetical protein
MLGRCLIDGVIFFFWFCRFVNGIFIEFFSHELNKKVTLVGVTFLDVTNNVTRLVGFCDITLEYLGHKKTR